MDTIPLDADLLWAGLSSVRYLLVPDHSWDWQRWTCDHTAGCWRTGEQVFQGNWIKQSILQNEPEKQKDVAIKRDSLGKGGLSGLIKPIIIHMDFQKYWLASQLFLGVLLQFTSMILLIAASRTQTGLSWCASLAPPYTMFTTLSHHRMYLGTPVVRTLFHKKKQRKETYDGRS